MILHSAAPAMTVPENLLRCKTCGGPLSRQAQTYRCQGCPQSYQTDNNVILMETGEGTDLRIGAECLDIENLRSTRSLLGRIVTSDVEFAARLHSVDFVNFHAEMLADYLDSSIVADVGCGQMPYLSAFPANKIRAYYGFDLHRDSLAHAQTHFDERFDLRLIQHGYDNLPLAAASVDAVISSEVIEHVDRPMDYLAEIHRVCRVGGHLSLSTPCASLYLYPHNFLHIARHPSTVRDLWRKLNAHRYWQEALAWHPGLRPRIMRAWMEAAGFAVRRHETRLWYYHTPLRPAWRFFEGLERIGMHYAGRLFERYLKATDHLLASHIPLLRWAGTRQFILGRKN